MTTLITKPEKTTIKKSTFFSAHKLILVLLSLILFVVIAMGGIGFTFSNTLLVPVHTNSFNLEITNVSTNSVTLPRTHDTEQPGIFGIFWAGNQAAMVGSITTENRTTVTRQLLQTTAPLANNTMVSFGRDTYRDGLISTLGLPIQTVKVPDPLGPMPAYYIPGKLKTWAIIVHGQNDALNADLRFIPPLATAGLPVLAISYRNDLNAPASPDGLDHLGDTEWQDLQAAVEYARQHGAQHFVLYGLSMGGTIVEMFMHRSSYASSVQAIILDSPILDWRSTLNYQAQRRHLPAIFADDVELMATLRAGINFNALDQMDRKQGTTPILLFQGTDDTTTPASICDAFARAHPNTVTYYRVTGADHVQSWNSHPELYDAEVTNFLNKQLHLHLAPLPGFPL
jgi:alpha-beta hydrolase superfamily lysophospholipase